MRHSATQWAETPFLFQRSVSFTQEISSLDVFIVKASRVLDPALGDYIEMQKNSEVRD